MSFVERNKTWLLPVLAVGVATVLWFDLRGSGTPAPADTAPALPQPSQAVEPPSAPMEPSSAPGPQPSGSSPTLDPEAWSDLKPLNTVPDILNQAAALTPQATRPLTAEQLAPPPPAGAAAPALAAPATLNLEAGADSRAAAPPPELEFISRTPEGLRAWYDGMGFKVGQTILGTAYRIRDIRPPKVVLDGPAGRVEQATFLLERPDAAAPEPETP